MSEVVKWVDQAMFEAEPIEKNEAGLVVPKVYLISATPDPLGTIAAACRMYEGKGTKSMTDITDEERVHYFEQSVKTHLKAPWEFVDLHFFIEGVSRAFTHQMVRQRTAVYAQESMRFAVKENMADEAALPPSLMGLKPDDPALTAYREAIQGVEDAYNKLVSSYGVPAEDARHLLPHATTTRLNYKTNLRGLLEHAGNRLCTQAQFEWRMVFLGIVQAIDSFQPALQFVNGEAVDQMWQFEKIAKSGLFRPVCFDKGSCPFKASFDRGCTIRDRVDAGKFDQIRPEEYMADPTAAWVQ